MASWQKEYLQALDDRDKKEKANYEFYSSYSKLADRMATVDQRASGDKDSSQALLSPSNVVNPAAAALSAPLSTENIAKIREDLGEAQRSKGIMQSRLQKVSDELQKLKMHSALDKNRIVELSSERTILLTKIKDRDEELKGKAKLLEDVHDETVSLTLQLNMAEENTKALKKENQDLVDRWMARMEQEADAMNRASKFA